MEREPAARAQHKGGISPILN